MKRIIQLLTILFAITIYSCGGNKVPSQDEIVKINIEEFLKQRMDDPGSYEFVDLDLVDSVLYIDNINRKLKDYDSSIKREQDRLDTQLGYKKDYPFLYKEKEVNKLKASIDRENKYKIKVDSIKNVMGNDVDNVASYTYIFSMRGNNKMGAKVLVEYIVQTGNSPDYEVLNMVTEREKMFVTPNVFPGYEEIMELVKSEI